MQVSKMLRQTAVLWRASALDAFGSPTYQAPEEIPVRWEDRNDLFINAEGEEQRSRAVVYVGEDIASPDYLFLGTLDDLASDQWADPTLLKNAYAVKTFQKSPDLRGKEFLRKAWL